MFGKSVRIRITLFVTIGLSHCMASSSVGPIAQPVPVSRNQLDTDPGSVDGFSIATANRGDFTYQVSIRSYGEHYCGGALISDRWALTSATCLRNGIYYLEDATIVVGAYNLREGYSYICDFVKVHEHFDTSTLENDIGLARTSRPIIFNKFIQPIPYYKGTEDCTVNAVSIGWGQNTGEPEQYLLYRNVTVYSRAVCVELLRDHQSTSTGILCAKNEPGHVTEYALCYTEYGVPIATSGSRVLFGIYSGLPIYGCDITMQEPFTFTLTSNTARWIFRNSDVDGVNSL